MDWDEESEDTANLARKTTIAEAYSRGRWLLGLLVLQVRQAFQLPSAQHAQGPPTCAAGCRAHPVLCWTNTSHCLKVGVLTAGSCCSAYLCLTLGTGADHLVVTLLLVTMLVGRWRQCRYGVPHLGSPTPVTASHLTERVETGNQSAIKVIRGLATGAISTSRESIVSTLKQQSIVGLLLGTGLAGTRAQQETDNMIV